MIDRSTLARDLGTLGVRAGSVLMVHAGMRSVGPVDGGAAAVLEALFDILGSSGTLLMVLGADDDEPFDAPTTPADEDMGILAEVFRQHPGTRVNDHAAARYGAAGPDAVWLLDPVPLHDYHGPGSVLERLTAIGGSVLRLGADPDTITLTHLAEYRADIPQKRRARLRYLRADTGAQWIESLDDSDGIAEWPHGDYFAQIWIDYRDLGRAAVGPVGNCTAELFRAADFVDFAVRWMETNLSRP